MFIENLIKETEKLLEEVEMPKLIKLWNRFFPEEKISLSSAREYSEEIIDELRFVVMDELQDIDLDKLIEIHNQIAEEKIIEEDIYRETDSLDDDSYEEE